MTKTYRPKKLIDGKVIGRDGWYVAIPDRNFKSGKVLVSYLGQTMLIDNWHKAESFRVFHDRFNRGNYTLGYFKFTPDL